MQNHDNLAVSLEEKSEEHKVLYGISEYLYQI